MNDCRVNFLCVSHPSLECGSLLHELLDCTSAQVCVEIVNSKIHLRDSNVPYDTRVLVVTGGAVQRRVRA